MYVLDADGESLKMYIIKMIMLWIPITITISYSRLLIVFTEKLFRADVAGVRADGSVRRDVGGWSAEHDDARPRVDDGCADESATIAPDNLLALAKQGHEGTLTRKQSLPPCRVYNTFVLRLRSLLAIFSRPWTQPWRWTSSPSLSIFLEFSFSSRKFFLNCLLPTERDVTLESRRLMKLDFVFAETCGIWTFVIPCWHPSVTFCRASTKCK